MNNSAIICTTFTDLSDIISDATRRSLEKWIFSIKFDGYAYAIIPKIDFSELFLLEGFNFGWRQQYIENNFHYIDPVIKKARGYQSPNIWSSVTLSVDDRFLNCAKNHGIRYGYSISLPLNTRYIGVLSIARKEDAFISQKESVNIIGMMSVYLQKLNNASLIEFNQKNSVEILPPLLTPRELECLHWLAEGKTSWEISRILSIAERTVIFHINNCMVKLEATNRVQTIMKAVRANVLK